jgi:hypothetical protein
VRASAAGSSRPRALQLWGHIAADLLCVTIVALVAMRQFPPPAALQLTLPLAMVIFVLASWIVMRWHDHGLCERCVAALPLDAAAQAARYRLRFRVAHVGGNPRYGLPYLAVIVLSNFAPGTPGRIFWSLAQLSLIYLLRCAVTHRRFQPWCPWCRGGGEDERSDAGPLPDDRRLLV